ncbi:MAG: hypothetical protein M3022_09595 [Actinomycetota bacterium]|nr:hypothetical protein [Actinomycetota bacterium]
MSSPPYPRRGAVNSNYYSQINVARTTEQILGIRPMNRTVRAAVPMYNAFTSQPDYTPYPSSPTRSR